MTKESRVVIGYYHLPSELKSRVYIEDVNSYEKEEYEVEKSEVVDFVNKLKEKYPNNNVCEFIY